jgi:hypothetical protein
MVHFFSCVAYTMGNLQPTVGPDGKVKELESNVLLASIENMQYAVTVDVLHTVRMIWFLVVNLKIKMACNVTFTITLTHNFRCFLLLELFKKLQCLRRTVECSL